MNTIKIYLQESGQVADLRKDFSLYQGQYQSKLVNVYVPTSVIATECAVKIGIKHLDRNGVIKKSRNFYMNEVKPITYNGVEYVLFERLLPKEFTMYTGTGMNAPKLVINVVDLDLLNNKVISVITSQECALDVEPSADLDNDEAIEPTALEEINAELNALNDELAQKQDKEDILLETTNKTVVGGINENKGNIDTNTTAIGENSTDIAELRNDVTDLQALLATGETPIGKMEGDELPTDEQLNAYVQSVVVRETAVGDVVIFVLDNTTTYKYTYTEDGWQSYEITTVDKADNSNYGVVEGTYTAEEQSAKVRNILADINNGKIENLYVKDGDNYRNLKEFLGTNKTAIANIIDGTTPVAEAIKAEQDGEGNNIVNTYLTQTAGATKQYVQDYAVPKTFTNIYFISADGYVSEPPAVSEAPAFSATTTGVGETEIIKDGDSSDLSMDLTASFDLSISNSYHNTFWVVASENCNVQFRLVTQYKKPTEEWTDLNVELSEEYPLVANNYERIDFSSQFLSLGSQTIELGLGDKIRQFLSVITQVDTPITFGVYSNTVYPSTFNLIAQNYVPAGATSVYVDGSPVSTWNANTKANASDVYTKTETDTLLGGYVTNTTTQEISGEKTFTGDNTYKTSGADYGAKIPNTTGWTGNKTLATTDEVEKKLGNNMGNFTSYTAGNVNDVNLLFTAGIFGYYNNPSNIPANFGYYGLVMVINSGEFIQQTLIANYDTPRVAVRYYNYTDTVWTNWEIVDGGNTYFTSEQAIGKWIDGSTIYRRVYDNITFSDNSSWTNVTNVSSLNIQTCIRLNGVLSLAEGTGDAGALYNIPTAEGGTYFRNLRLYNNYIQTINNGFIGSGFIVIEYTKNN